MEFLVFIIIAITAGTLLAGGQRVEQQARLRLYAEQALKQLGWEQRRGVVSATGALSGSCKGLHFHLSCRETGEGSELDICLSFLRPLKLSFHITTWASSFQEDMFNPHRDQQVTLNSIPDPAFKEKLYLQAVEDDAMLAFLDALTRQQLIQLVEQGSLLAINNEELRYVHCPHPDTGPDQLVALLQQLISLCKRIQGSSRSRNEARLISNATRDPVPEMRLANLRCLKRNYGRNSTFRKMLGIALKDKFPSMRLEAALSLGKEGCPELARLLQQEQHLPLQDRKRIVDQLKTLQYTQARAVLEQYFVKETDDALRIAIVNTLNTFDDPGSEPFLLTQLLSSKGRLRITIVNALGQCGSLDAVATLWELAHKGINPALHNAAQQAIAKIQERCSTGDAGWLTVDKAHPVAGGLSKKQQARDGGLSK